MAVFCSPEGARSIMADGRRHSTILSHPQTPPFKCTICHYSFPKQEHLDLHYQQIHQLSGHSVPQDTGYRTPIACLHCAKAKTKCDKKIPCGRCARRDLPCQSRPTRRTIYTDTPYSNIEPRRPQSGHYDPRWAYESAQNQAHDKRRSMVDPTDLPHSPTSPMSAGDVSSRSSISAAMPNGGYHSEIGGYMPGAYHSMATGYGATPVTYAPMASSTVPRDMISGPTSIAQYAPTSMATSHDVQYPNAVSAAPGYVQSGVMYGMPVQNDPVNMGYDMYSQSQTTVASPIRYTVRESVGGHSGSGSWPYYSPEAAPGR